MNASPANDVASISPRDHILTSSSDDVIQLQPPVRFCNSAEVTEYNKEELKLTDSEYGPVLSSTNILRVQFAFAH